MTYSAKQIDRHRYALVEYNDWADSDEEWFTEKMDKIGIEVIQTYWSLTCSQGDGACFDGKIVDWGKYLCSIGYDDPILHKAAEENFSLSWAQYGHYVHENSLVFDDDLWLAEVDIEDMEEVELFKHHVREATLGQYDLFMLVDTIKDDIKSKCVELKKELERTYDDLISDKCVIDFLTENEIKPTNED